MNKSDDPKPGPIEPTKSVSGQAVRAGLIFLMLMFAVILAVVVGIVLIFNAMMN